MKIGVSKPMLELLLIVVEQGVLATLATGFGLHHTLRHGWDGGAAVSVECVVRSSESWLSESRQRIL